jgi:hypothetical protein
MNFGHFGGKQNCCAQSRLGNYTNMTQKTQPFGIGTKKKYFSNDALYDDWPFSYGISSIPKMIE